MARTLYELMHTRWHARNANCSAFGRRPTRTFGDVGISVAIRWKADLEYALADASAV